MSKPLIALSLCRWQLKDRDEGWYHLVGEKYVRAITNYGAFPFTVPALAGDLGRAVGANRGSQAANCEPWDGL